MPLRYTTTADVKAVKDSDTFEVILSTSDVDRDGERIAAFAFDPLPDHITFDIDHELTVAGTVGSGRPEYSKDGTQLYVHGRWASTPLATMVRTLVEEGHIRTTSVAFMPAPGASGKDKSDGVWTITKGDLLNGAFVAVPANPAAIVLAAKSFTAALADDLEAQTPDSVQITEPVQATEDPEPDDADTTAEPADAPAPADPADEPAEPDDEVPSDIREATAARASALHGVADHTQE